MDAPAETGSAAGVSADEPAAADVVAAAHADPGEEGGDDAPRHERQHDEQYR
jgi:hypothetical protein